MDKILQGNGRDPREVVTQHTYDRVAAKYAHTRCGKGAWKEELTLLWHFLQKAGKRKKRLLDLGCGTGRVLQHALQENMPLAQYTGIDYSTPMLDEALTWSIATKIPLLCERHTNLRFLEKPLQRLKHILQRPQTRVALVTERMQDIDPPTSYFDGVSMLASFHHLLTLEDQETVLELCFHTLKPGGILFMTLWQPKEAIPDAVRPVPFSEQGVATDRFYYIFSRSAVERLLRYAGFKILSLQEAAGKQGNMVIVAEKPRLSSLKDMETFGEQAAIPKE